ncbi:DoxX family protein [Candidatus Woesearchaeota archaeon]|nr:DoxX family protein [Candidatus Woesearchaeota archaeon]
MKKYADYLYFVFRVLVGFFFLMHGGQKLFGWFGGLGGNSAELISLMGLAGLIEFFGGLAVLLGIFTRLTALIAAVEMIVALFMAHFPRGYVLILNGGEAAALFFTSFLVLLAYGAGKFSLGKYLFKKELL